MVLPFRYRESLKQSGQSLVIASAYCKAGLLTEKGRSWSFAVVAALISFNSIYIGLFVKVRFFIVIVLYSFVPLPTKGLTLGLFANAS